MDAATGLAKFKAALAALKAPFKAVIENVVSERPLARFEKLLG